MKRRGRIIVITLIIALLISFILVENLRQILPEPVIGRISNWKVDESSDENNTILKAEINISYPKKQFIGLLNNTIEFIIFEGKFLDGKIFYKNKSNTQIQIGDISLTSPDEGKNKDFIGATPGKSEKERKIKKIVELKPGTSITPYIYFRFYNHKLPYIWRDQLINKEGEILANINISFAVLNKTINISFLGVWRENISLEITDKLNDILESLDFNGKIWERNIFNTKITFNIVKHSKEILLESQIENPFFNRRCIIWAIHLLDKLSISKVSNDFSIFQCNFSFNKSTMLNFFYEKYFPEELKIDFNNLDIIDISLNPLFEPIKEKHRLSTYRWKERDFNMKLIINNKLLGNWTYSHINNNETTDVKIYTDNEHNNITTNFSTNISGMLPDILLKINKTKLKEYEELLIRVQMLIIAGLTGLSMFLIYDYLYNHKSRKK